MTVDIIIPNYNGQKLLEKNLPIVINNSRNIHQIIIVDDGSNDNSDLFLKEKYPQITLIKNHSNLGFTKSVNIALNKSNSDLFVLLNNDVRPEPKYLENSLKHFKNKQIFAVSFSEQENSWPDVFWGDGKLEFIQGSDKRKTRFTPWASGGSAIFRRLIWDKLRGFDEIYSPGYWEDIDIGWRAWKSGYLIIWEPNAKVIHQHQSSFKKVNQNYLNLIKQRNELIFNYKNITDQKMRNSFYRSLIKRTLKHPGYTKVIFSYIQKMPEIKKYQYPISDPEVFELIKKPVNQ